LCIVNTKISAILLDNMTTKTQPGLAKAQLTADVVMFTIEDNTLEVLLVKRAHEPYKDQWALPGGFLWNGEATKQTAERILCDKAGVEGMYIEQLYTFDSPGRDPRGQIVSVAYFALVARESLKINLSAKTQHPTLFPVASLPQLAFDHQHIISYAHRRLQAKIQYTNAVYSLLPPAFTFNQLQSVYETILGRSLDRRNFRKKFMSLGLIRPTGQKLTGICFPATDRTQPLVLS
jgi:8-oxo-dGTP diphosphatase